MSTLFISDLHLEDNQPRTTGWLLEFLSGPARNAEAVYILGDLFEYWIGDDALSATANKVAGALTELSENGVPCYFMHGNRDFLLGDSYASRAGITLVHEPLVINLYGTPTLLLHGDSLCTDDVEYQAFRSQTRNPAWQAAVLARSVAERLQMAQEARNASKTHTETVSMDIMDVNELTVGEQFRKYQVERIIHGHTHRPARHRYVLEDSREVERVVLADWYTKSSYLSVSPNGLESVTPASDAP
jgi:UDP-2,3-diacylglucosamine hydrolase